MTNIILCGCGGRMGKAIVASAKNDCTIVAGVDINASALSATCSFPVYERISDFPGKADVIVTADLPHHVIKALVESGKCVLQFTHYTTEVYGFKKFSDALKNIVNVVFYDEEIYK